MDIYGLRRQLPILAVRKGKLERAMAMKQADREDEVSFFKLHLAGFLTEPLAHSLSHMPSLLLWPLLQAGLTIAFSFPVHSFCSISLF